MELKPCPFCGGTRNKFYRYKRYPSGYLWEVTCINCLYHSYHEVSAFGSTKREAAEKWNHRKETNEQA